MSMLTFAVLVAEVQFLQHLDNSNFDEFPVTFLEFQEVFLSFNEVTGAIPSLGVCVIVLDDIERFLFRQNTLW